MINNFIPVEILQWVIFLKYGLLLIYLVIDNKISIIFDTLHSMFFYRLNVLVGYYIIFLFYYFCIYGQLASPP